MQKTDIAALNTHLQRLYGQSYTGISTAMAEIWYKRLQGFPAALIEPAIERWAVNHLPRHVPAIEDLATIMEDIRREQRAASRGGPEGDPRWSMTAEELVAWREVEMPEASVHALVDDLMAMLAQKEAEAKATPPQQPCENPPNPARWLPLTDDLSPGQDQTLGRTPPMTKLLQDPGQRPDRTESEEV
jgi:hypothetical protein